MWALPFGLRDVLDLRETCTSRCAFAALTCLLPHTYVLQGRAVRVPWVPACGSWSVPSSQLVGSRYQVIKCWAALTDWWSLVGFTQGRFSRPPVLHYLRKYTTQTWHNLHFRWNVHPQRCLQCSHVWSIISSTLHSIRKLNLLIDNGSLFRWSF